MIIKNALFVSTGKLSLFISGGQVVSDIEWQPDITDTEEFTYADLQHPKVSDGLWNKIEAVEAGKEATLTSGDYHIFVSHIAEYAEQYYLVVFVKTSEIYESTKAELDAMEEGNTTTSLIVVFVFLVLFLLLMALMILLINGILKTFAEMESNVDTLLSNVGHTEKFLADGMVDVRSANTTELVNMQSNMNTMIRNLQDARQQTGATTTANMGFQQSGAFFEMVPLTNIQPTAPPVTYAYPVSGSNAAPVVTVVTASVPLNTHI